MNYKFQNNVFQSKGTLNTSISGPNPKGMPCTYTLQVDEDVGIAALQTAERTFTTVVVGCVGQGRSELV